MVRRIPRTMDRLYMEYGADAAACVLLVHQFGPEVEGVEQAYGLNVNGACVISPMRFPVPGTAKAPNQA